MTIKHVLALGCALILTTACANKPEAESEFAASEASLGTDGAISQQFHSVIYYPDELSLQFPGYIVGVEKVRVAKISDTPKEVILTTPVPNNHNSAADLYDLLIDQKTMLVTHIMRNQGKRNCAIYSAYRSSDSENSEHCEQENRFEGNLYQQSWQAMAALRHNLEADISAKKANDDPTDDYTHIFVLVMGWNTDQEEAVRNFNSIIGNLQKASEEQMKPLFIGLTWPSLWSSSFIDPLAKMFSYPNKANDADEVGLSWLGVLIHQTIKDLDVAKTIVVGHSFGARATSMATCVGPAITQDGTMLARNNIDLLVSLQGAYSISRFYPDRGIETPQYQYCRQATKVLLTSSIRDTAMDTGIWAPFVGNETTYTKYCEDKIEDNFSCHKVGPTGKYNFGDIKERFVYVNADELIRFIAYKSGGGAHSDIYREPMADFLWSAISTMASAK